MKQFITVLLPIFILFGANNLFAIGGGCTVPNCQGHPDDGFTSNDETTFRRTYAKRSKSVNHKTIDMANFRSGNEVVINKSDFEGHLALDQNRIFRVIPIGNSIPMDVGAFDQFGDEAQVWNMPDFSQYNVIENFTIEQITPEESGFEDAFPEATHCFFMAYYNVYEYLEMAEDDLFVLGRVEVDENDEGDVFDTYLTATPFPLELGLEFEGTVIIEYTEDPDIDSLIYTQEYIVSGYGTFNFEDGPVDALKLNYTQTIVEYKGGQVIDSRFVREVVWYSVEGHYVRGSLPEGEPLEGQTTFAHMEYQRLDTGVSTNEVTTKATSLNYFPNPVSAGDVLTVTHTTDTHFGLVRLYDIQGRLVQQLDLSGMGAVRNFQVQVPADLPAGMYTYRVHSPQGAALSQGKLHVR